MIENKDAEVNKSDLFGLLAKWASLLPKPGEVNSSSTAGLRSLGTEIQRLCSEAESKYDVIAPATSKPTESVLRPSFIFQLTTDDVVNSAQSKFDCVYDFCQKLEQHCENSNNNLDINTDWLKLLMACSSHNYERFMWIHMTFQDSNNLKFKWPPVKKRLMSKFDDPARRVSLMRQITGAKYLSELESIDIYNQRFCRLADEAQIEVKEHYINSLPVGYQEVLHSTMAYDQSCYFECTLEDIQQRATLFILANEGDFVFYSKSAHIAVRLEHEKVNQSKCEFHLLADHKTSCCPDYVIVKYPYINFNPIPGIIAKPTITAFPSQANEFISPAQSSSPPPVPLNATVTQVIPTTKQDVLAPQTEATSANQLETNANVKDMKVKSALADMSTSENLQKKAAPSEESLLQIAQFNQIAQSIKVKHTQPIFTKEPMQIKSTSTETQPAQQQAVTASNTPAPRPSTTESAENQVAVYAGQYVSKVKLEETEPIPSQVETFIASTTPPTPDYNSMGDRQIVECARAFIASNQALPVALRGRFSQIKTHMISNTDINKHTLPPRNKVVAHPSPPAAPPVASSSRGHISTIPPHGPRDRRSPSPSQHRAPSRAVGCEIHGRDARHTTNECRQAMLSRKRDERSESPDIGNSSRKIPKRRRGEDDERNICIFCGLIFKPGHLMTCKEVRGGRRRL